MSRKKRKAKENPLKSKDWFKWKARQLRASHLGRLKKVSGEEYKQRMREVPTATEFEEWLKKQSPFLCLYSKEAIKSSSLEIDHRTPVSREGAFGFSNLAVTNRLHNRTKGDLTEKEYKQLLRLLSKWDEKAKWSVINRLIQSTGIYRKRK